MIGSRIEIGHLVADRLSCGTLRRPLLLSALMGLVVATSASAALTPIRRDARGGEAALPRVRAGALHIPAAQRRGLTRVIVRLAAPPLAAWNAERSLAFASRAHHLDVGSASSRAYLARLARLQDAAAAQVRAAVPHAQIQERYSILLDGFAVQVPSR